MPQLRISQFRQNGGARETFTVRKQASGVGEGKNTYI